VKCRWTNKVLGPVPSKDSQGQEYNAFERGEEDEVVIPANCVRAMLQKALPFIGKERSVAFHVGTQAVRIFNPKVFRHRRGLAPEIGGGQGKGLGIRDNEALPAGTEFSLTLHLPTTALTAPECLRLLQIAGRFVRFSPAASSAFGDFEIVKEE
jgi:hypothetical protein